MGKKVVIILAIFVVAIMALLIPIIIDHYIIKDSLEGLYSRDAEVREQAADDLAKYGAEIVPQLILEYKKQLQVDGKSEAILGSNVHGKKTIYFDHGLIQALSGIGESSLPLLFNELTNNDQRFEKIVIIVVLLIYGDEEKVNDPLRSIMLYQILEPGPNTKRTFVTKASFQSSLAPLASLEQKIEISGFNSNKWAWDEVKISPPSLKPLLKDICDDNSLKFRIGRNWDRLRYSSKNCEIYSGSVIDSARSALKKLGD